MEDRTPLWPRLILAGCALVAAAATGVVRLDPYFAIPVVVAGAGAMAPLSYRGGERLATAFSTEPACTGTT
ncbi:MAG TPA: hypothetical protein VFJ85_17820 [Acidimicrobiales bacterium]|nr:hypothetical protein [Acidimicrobiales bacterium]